MTARGAAEACDVEIDVCKAHGLWLDAGELPGLRAFVHGGGLDRVQRSAAPATTPPGDPPNRRRGVALWDVVDLLILLDVLSGS